MVEHWFGTEIVRTRWDGGFSADHFIEELTTVLRQSGQYRDPLPGAEFLGRIIDDFAYAYDLRTGSTSAPTDIGALLQRTSRQWIVTSDGLECTERSYTIQWGRFSEPGWYRHMEEKGWVNMEEFWSSFNVAEALEKHDRVTIDGQ